MRNTVTLIVAILPAYLIGLYVYNKDKDKESRGLLTKLFILGMLSCLPAIILELVLGLFFGNIESMNLIDLFLYILISIALAEEFCKWFVVKKVAYNNPEFDHVYDSIVYCVFVALGFATLENIFYVFEGGIITGLMRAVSAIPGHSADAIIMANYIGLAKIAQINGNYKQEKRNMFLSIIMPTLAHGLYDYCLFTENIIFFILFIVFLVYIYCYSFRKIKKLSAINDNFIITYNNINYCPNCGTKATGLYCTNCGEKLHLSEINNDNT